MQEVTAVQIDILEASGPTAANDLVAQLEALAKERGQMPDFASVHYNCLINPEPVMTSLATAGTAAIGASSCGGAMTHTGTTTGLSAFCLSDGGGDYGVCSLAFDEKDPFDVAARATKTALSHANRAGEKPEMIWLAVTPGCEERVLLGIESIVGEDTPIVGGSAADNDISGQWSVLSPDGRHTSGIAVAVLFPTGTVSIAYQSGYVPTQITGTATQVTDRIIREIDHRPAATVYSDWTKGAVPGTVEPGHSTRPILSQSTFFPLGRPMASDGNDSEYLLAHPATLDDAGGVHMFANIEEGEPLTLMNGSTEELATRAGRVASLAKATSGTSNTQIAGALVIYCGGCRLALGDEVETVARTLREEMGTNPFLGIFTFGEQGPMVGYGNRHGNLMISAIIFGH
ncbi:MAG: hypothetical protein ACJAQW_000509 [Paracoccaceae bacterium]|jgi:hypothetical protein